MSWEAMVWAIQQKAPNSSAKFVLVGLGNCASPEDWHAWPSVAYISDCTQQDRKTVLVNLARLEAAGLISRAGSAGRTNQVTKWRLSVPKDWTPFGSAGNSTKNGTGPKNGTVPLFPANSTKNGTATSTKNGTRNHKGNHEGNREGRATRADAAVRGSRLPVDWVLPDEGRTYCSQQRPDLDPDAVAADFRDYWTAAAGAKARKADWAATWRRWVREQRQGTQQRATAPASILNADQQFRP